jgi:hypothetical protein
MFLMTTSEERLGEFPPRWRSYSVMTGLFTKHLEGLKTKLGDQYSNYLDEFPQYLPFVEKIEPLVLETVGSDAVNIDSIGFDLRSDPAYGSLRHHDALNLHLYLYNDGSPFVAEGDSLADGHALSNVYIVTLSPELPPTIMQANQCVGLYNAEEWATARKCEITDADCEALMNLAQTQELAMQDILG